MHTQLMDVTLREVGHLADYAFDSESAATIVTALAAGRVDLIEVGYFRPRVPADRGSLTCDPEYLKAVQHATAGRSELVVMVHMNEVEPEDYARVAPFASVVRLATTPEVLDDLASHVEAIRRCGMRSSVNLTRVSERPLDVVVDCARTAEAVGADWFYVADSNGSLFPDRTGAILGELVANLTIPVGFHGHDNLRLAFANTLAAQAAGATLIDASLGGIGKGGGNLTTELVALYLNRQRHAVSFGVERLALATELLPASLQQHRQGPRRETIMAGLLDLNATEIGELEGRARAAGTPPVLLYEQLMREGVTV